MKILSYTFKNVTNEAFFFQMNANCVIFLGEKWPSNVGCGDGFVAVSALVASKTFILPSIACVNLCVVFWCSCVF